VKNGFWKWVGKTAKNAEPTDEEKKAAADKIAAEKAEADKKNASEAGEGADGADQFVMIEGKKVALKDLVDAYQGSAENAGDGMGDDEQVELANGETCTVGDLKRAYMSKRNAEDAGSTEGADDVEKDLEKARAANAKGGKTGKEANGHFIKVKNAAEREAESLAPQIETKAERLKNGQSRYGSPVKTEKAVV